MLYTYVTSILYLSEIQMQSYNTDLESNFMNVFQRKQSVHLHEESKTVRGLETESRMVVTRG